MKFRSGLAALIPATALAVATVAPAPASGVTPNYAYFGASGGSQISAVGTTITSSMTAISQIAGTVQPHTTSNKVASVKAAPLATLGAVTTSETATPVGDGWKLVGKAHTAGVNLLNGLIKISAVDTVTTAQFDTDGGGSGTSNTQFVGLTIAGKTYPVNIAKNTTITVPGVVTVQLNYQNVVQNDTSVSVQGAGLVVTLLKTQGTAAIGSTIVLNPTFGNVQRSSGPGGRQLGGAAFGSYVFAGVGEDVQVQSGRTAYAEMPAIGTGGVIHENHTAKVNLPGVLNTTGIASTMQGVSTQALNYSKTATRTVDLNLFPSLFGSLIHADAIGTNSSATVQNGNATLSGGTQFVNLRIAGQQIPVDVAPNTKIHVANLGYVTINEQTKAEIDGVFHGIQVTALHIVLDTAKAGLPVGAEIQIGFSRAFVWG
jgi:hypothetical protein